MRKKLVAQAYTSKLLQIGTLRPIRINNCLATFILYPRVVSINNLLYSRVVSISNLLYSLVVSITGIVIFYIRV